MTLYEYERNSTNIDMETTNFFIDLANTRIENQEDLIRMGVIGGYFRKELQKYKNELDSLQLVKEKLLLKSDSLDNSSDEGTIKFIYLLADYRANNAFGALVKTQSEILYRYQEKTFEVLPE